jgi:hypothetical protein
MRFATTTFIYVLAFYCQAQQRPSKVSNWGFRAGAWILWNTVHGDRYVPPQPLLPGIPLRDVDVTRWRSFAKNSFSPATGIMVERRLWKGLWLAGGLEFVGRHQKYVFDADTVAAYPPTFPPPAGLYVTRVMDFWYGLELPVVTEYRYMDWSVAAGVIVSKQLRIKGVAELRDGTSLVLYDIPARNNPVLNTAIPKVVFGYDGFGQEKRFRLMLGADIRKRYGAVRRWVDIRFGASVRIGG